MTFYLKILLFKAIDIISKVFKIKTLTLLNSDLQYALMKEKLIKKGVTIGKNTIVYNCTFSSSTKGDRFFIGNDCTLTGATFLAHDASPTLFLEALQQDPKVWRPASRLSYRSPIKVGNNVFIGHGAIIMPGVEIGSNVVIGEGSVVTRNISDNVVVAGNPAIVVKSIEGFITKYQKKYSEQPENF